MSTGKLCLLCSEKATMAYNCVMIPTYCWRHALGGMVTANGNGKYEYYMCGGWLRDQQQKNKEMEDKKDESTLNTTNSFDENDTYICIENNCNNEAIFSSSLNTKPTACRKHTRAFMMRTIKIKK